MSNTYGGEKRPDRRAVAEDWKLSDIHVLNYHLENGVRKSDVVVKVDILCPQTGEIRQVRIQETQFIKRLFRYR